MYSLFLTHLSFSKHFQGQGIYHPATVGSQKSRPGHGKVPVGIQIRGFSLNSTEPVQPSQKHSYLNCGLEVKAIAEYL